MQRRLATIVIADVVGYSALIHADEAGTRAKFRALAADVVAPLTATHSGRLIKTMGDAFFLEFASAVEAVSFAAELQDQIGASDGTALTLRIGINLGDVIVEDDDIHGEGVNIAARLEPIAVPGGVCVSAKVYEEVRGKLDLAFSDGGERELKNIAEPVHVYHLGGDKVPPVSRTNATLADETKPIVNVPAFTFTGKGDDVAELAEGLRDAMIEGLATFNAIDVSREEISRRADYVLKGGVRGAGNRIRINFSLLDCATGVEFWARRYDRTSEDLFEIEDEISSTVILIIRIRLNERAAARLAGTDVSTLNVQQLLTKAAGIMVETTGGFEPVKSYLEMALEKDPENSMGHGMLAFCHWRNHEFSPMDIAVESKDMIIDYCARSRALDPGSYVALFITAVCHGDLLGDRRAMQDYALHALRISPGYQQGQTTAAIAKAYLDPNPENAAALGKLVPSMREEPLRFQIQRDFSMILTMADQFDEAVEVTRHLQQQVPELQRNSLVAVGVYGLAGQTDAARDCAAGLLSNFPKLTLSTIRPVWLSDDNQTARFHAALVAAGIPD